VAAERVDVDALVSKAQAQQAAEALLERMKTGSEAAANLAAAGQGQRGGGGAAGVSERTTRDSRHARKRDPRRWPRSTRPWLPTPWEAADALSMQRLAAGTANADRAEARDALDPHLHGTAR
jgi:hypothetical protein